MRITKHRLEKYGHVRNGKTVIMEFNDEQTAKQFIKVWKEMKKI